MQARHNLRQVLREGAGPRAEANPLERLRAAQAGLAVVERQAESDGLTRCLTAGCIREGERLLQAALLEYEQDGSSNEGTSERLDRAVDEAEERILARFSESLGRNGVLAEVRTLVDTERPMPCEAAMAPCDPCAPCPPYSPCAPCSPCASGLPEFPLPHPAPSAQFTIPDSLLRRSGDDPATLGSIDRLLAGALFRAGHGDWRYYAVPNGFAIVCKLEQIDDSGYPRGEHRWSDDIPPVGNLVGWLRSLVLPRAGRWRVAVFVTTDQTLTATSKPLERDEAMAWLRGGGNRLPAELRETPLSVDHACTVLVYEFYQPTPDHPVERVPSSDITGRDHLERGKVWAGLVAP